MNFCHLKYFLKHTLGTIVFFLSKIISENISTNFIDTAWERIPLTPAMKQALWRTQNGMYSMYDPSLAYLRRQLPEPVPDSGQQAWKVIEASKTLFLSLDLFFVKVCGSPRFTYEPPNKTPGL